MTSEILVNIGSGNGYKSLPESMLIYHLQGPMVFIQGYYSQGINTPVELEIISTSPKGQWDKNKAS